MMGETGFAKALASVVGAVYTYLQAQASDKKESRPLCLQLVCILAHNMYSRKL